MNRAERKSFCCITALDFKSRNKNISLSEKKANKKVDFLCPLSANYEHHRCSNA